MSESITIHQIFISSGHDFKGRFNKGRLNNGVQPVESVECVAGRGLVGDRYFDFKEDYKGQVSFIAEEAIEALEAELGLKVEDRSDFRRNVVVSGTDLNALVGQDFRIGEVVLRGVEQCKPCFWMNEAIGPGAHEALEGRGGLRCRILESGVLRAGPAQIEAVVD
ncbi:MOSC domain-containing protein [Pelagicoccus sp. SDUM812005]|uniref:MOSC domain-containing protein n=1 Tax=Pelagicoccus sp. SDUM812005 TaxID=3041257 RepID=UPI00280C6B74|nr:MOSC domain-containing protein [Pelagicoccus sp. SDUM812005]MDQ8180427.1 MOSC domain-containing protein [Pelagicoccus sp. SDUM812005]